MFFREMLDDEFPSIIFANMEITNQYKYESIKYGNILLIHGDIFDAVTVKHRWLSKFGSFADDTIIMLNTVVTKILRKLGFKVNWSFAKWVKKKVKRVLTYYHSYYEVSKAYAVSKGYNGVISGHVHNPVLIDEPNFLNANTGDWVESCSAVVEDEHGNFKIIKW
jgi:UDP-2,3-diacylglucosamine pyrophosphatase LpxH